MRYVISLITLSAFILFSCSSMKKKGATKPSNALAGTAWTIEKIPQFEMEHLKKKPIISFSDSTDRISGHGGCNGFGGNYTVNGQKLKFEKIIATMMACMEGSKTENKLMQAFNNTDGYEIKGDMLQLKQGDIVLAEFRKSKKD